METPIIEAQIATLVSPRLRVDSRDDLARSQRKPVG